MKYFLTETKNANTDVTIYDKKPKFWESKEISEQEALEILYKEVDPQGDYPIDDYKLIHSESLGRYGITYK
jgi:hypothetical protein